RSGLAGRIIFTGQIADVRPYYAVANVFVLPSHSEGSPNVLLEAMSARLPVVAASVGGLPEMVEDGLSALLVPAKQPTKIADAVARVFSDSDLAAKLAEAGAALVVSNHSPSDYVLAVLKIYREAMANRKTA